MSIWSKSIVHKLINRQVHGTYQHKHNAQNNARCFFEKIPDHCTFNISDIIKNTDHLANHMFMGLTRCGKFLMSYTNCQSKLGYLQYKLYFWIFGMGQKARLISEIILFENYPIKDLLNIQIFQWPNRSDRVIVVGESTLRDSPIIFITITTIPVLKFKDSQIRANENKDFSEYDSECYVSGVTVHTLFMLSRLWPEPSLAFKYDDHIVLSRHKYFADTLISILYIDLDNEQVIESDQSEIINSPIFNKLSIDLIAHGYKIPTESDNSENGVEKKRIETKYYFVRDKNNPLNMKRIDGKFRNDILNEKYTSKHIKENKLEIRLLSNNAAVIICDIEGVTFWNQTFCNFAIIDICPMNGDTLIELEILLTCKEFEGHSITYKYFKTKCVVLWNGKTNDCYLEGYQKLDEVEFSELSTIINHKTDGIHLRQANLGFFNINRGNQVRCLRDIWNSQEGCSNTLNVPSIQDDENMVIIFRN